jgi:hypothetical protein
MRHFAVKSGVWLALLAAAAVTSQVSLTAFVVLSTLTLCSAFARISDAAADCFAPEEQELCREDARLRAENERLTDEVERLQESYESSQSAVLYHQTSAELLREHLAAARQGRVWPASATPTPLPQRIPQQSADEVGELPALVQPGLIDVMQTLRGEGDRS